MWRARARFPAARRTTRTITSLSWRWFARSAPASRALTACARRRRGCANSSARRSPPPRARGRGATQDAQGDVRGRGRRRRRRRRRRRGARRKATVRERAPRSTTPSTTKASSSPSKFHLSPARARAHPRVCRRPHDSASARANSPRRPPPQVPRVRLRGTRVLLLPPTVPFGGFRDALTDRVREAHDTKRTRIERAHVTVVPVRRDRPETYGAMSSQTYGLAPEPAVFSPALVRNRQNPRALACLAAALGLDDPRDALVSQDGCVRVPAHAGRRGRGARDRDYPGASLRQAAGFEPARRGARRWTRSTTRTDCHSTVAAISARRRMRCAPPRDPTCRVCSRCRTTSNARGFRAPTSFVPGFHASSTSRGALGPKDAYVDAHDDKRRNHLVWRGDGAGSFAFGDNDAAHRLRFESRFGRGLSHLPTNACVTRIGAALRFRPSENRAVSQLLSKGRAGAEG